MNSFKIRAWLVGSLLLLAQGCFAQATAVLIIDDMGNALGVGQRALELPGKVNYSFLPHTPDCRRLAEMAHLRGKEILLHLPMSNLSGTPAGPGKLTPIMDRTQFSDTFEGDLQSVPYARGVNNHMGSLLTQLTQPMQWLMDDLKQHHLYFIDSRTSPLTVAEKMALDNHVPALRRNVFLDDDLSRIKIEQQVNKWLRLARKKGLAVAIGHPHPQTLAVLEQVLPTLQQRGIHLAFASDVLNQQFADSSAAISRSAVPTGNSPTAKN